MIISLLYIFQLFINIDSYIYQPIEVISFFRNITLDQDECESIKNTLPKILYDYYAFYHISKNPPQPDFDPNYHNIIDFEKEFEGIGTVNRDFYSFYQDIARIIAKTKDFHFSLDFKNINNFLQEFKIMFPIGLNISLVNGKEYIYGVNYIEDEDIKKSFRNYEDIFNIIDSNENIPIKSINGKDPFDFIGDFGNDFFNFRSPHGNFFFKYHWIPIGPLVQSYEELINLTIIYENGKNFTTDYIIVSSININDEKSGNFFKENKEINNNIFSLNNIKKYRDTNLENNTGSILMSPPAEKLLRLPPLII